MQIIWFSGVQNVRNSFNLQSCFICTGHKMQTNQQTNKIMWEKYADVYGSWLFTHTDRLLIDFYTFFWSAIKYRSHFLFWIPYTLLETINIFSFSTQTKRISLRIYNDNFNIFDGMKIPWLLSFQQNYCYCLIFHTLRFTPNHFD